MTRARTGIAAASLPPSLQDAAVRVGDPAYAALKDTYSYIGLPALILRPGTSQEVADAVSFAVAAGVDLSVRSGGHGISSRSTNDGGVVIHLGRLDTVGRDAAGHVVVGAGARWEQVARALAPEDLAITSGDSGDVGVGGLATTGGLGLLARRFGLTIDHLTAATVVTACGDVVHTDVDHDPDLFWAVRGAGANVGVVTHFTFRPDPVPGVLDTTLVYEPRDPVAFLQQWSDVVTQAPRSLTGFLYLSADGRGRVAALARIVTTTDQDTARSTMRDAVDALGVPAGGSSRFVSYHRLFPPPGGPQRGAADLATRSVNTGPIGADLAEGLVDLLTSGQALTVQLRCLGGAVHDVAPDATAFAHRHQEFSVLVAADPRDTAGLDRAWAPVRAHGDGLYLSFDNSHDPALLSSAFPGATLDRLRQVKASWDPGDVFRHNFSVGPTGPGRSPGQ